MALREWPPGDSEMARRTREFEWSVTPLGSPDAWPDPLRTAVALCLASPLPILVGWGGELPVFCNDACLSLLAPERQRVAVGRPAREALADIWPQIGPVLGRTMTDGIGGSCEDVPMSGSSEQAVPVVFATWVTTPIVGAHGAVEGVFVAGIDSTAKVIAQRQLAAVGPFADGSMTQKNELGGEPLPNPHGAGRERLARDRAQARVGRETEARPDSVTNADAGKPDEQLRQDNALLAQGMDDLELANRALRDSRLATMSLLEDALTARGLMERVTTELRESEEQLREADRRKNYFLAILGHELRNPLAAIRGGITLLQSPRTRPETRAATLPIVADQVAHMERLIDDLIDVTRIIEGRLQLQLRRMTLQTTLAQAVELARGREDASAFDIRLTMPPEPLIVFADPMRQAQVFGNLLTNAVKHSGAAGRIEVAAERRGSTVVVSVCDDGPGISPELLPRIFDPFVQAKPSLTLEGGLGLGLAVVRQIVVQHHGKVEALSGNGRRGSEFFVHLPLSEGPR